MTKSMLAVLCTAVAVLAGGSAFAAQPYHPDQLPPLFVDPAKAQAACPADQVVWVNWTARKSHVPGQWYYANTRNGAYACAQASAQAGIEPATN